MSSSPSLRKALTNQELINSDHPIAFFQQMSQTMSRGNVRKGEIKNWAKDGTFY